MEGPPAMREADERSSQACVGQPTDPLSQRALAADETNSVPRPDVNSPAKDNRRPEPASSSKPSGDLNLQTLSVADDPSTHIIPGVEHVFFEDEFVKMEQQHDSGNEQIVVFAADNSEPSDLAFKFYVDNVNRPGYKLHIVHHSNYWGHYEPMDGGPSPKHCEELAQKESVKVGDMKKKYEDLMQANNIKGEFITLHGKDAWHDIIQHQEKVHAMLIVMGTRGQSAVRRTFLGSVSDSVVHHAHCPVLVCCHPPKH